MSSPCAVMPTHSSPSDLRIVDVARVAAGDPGLLARCEALHRTLRPQLPPDYLDAMARIFANGGRMCAVLSGGDVVALAVFRVIENTISGRFLYIDDIVTDADRRSRGVGAAVLARCEAIASAEGCAEVVLDSGVQRAAAHRFYFRQGYSIRAFNFAKPVAPPA